MPFNTVPLGTDDGCRCGAGATLLLPESVISGYKFPYSNTCCESGSYPVHFSMQLCMQMSE